jgi:hypothetical protein
MLFLSLTSEVGKKDTQDKEERRDQAAYMALNKNLIEPLMRWKFISVEKIDFTSHRVVN